MAALQGTLKSYNELMFKISEFMWSFLKEYTNDYFTVCIFPEKQIIWKILAITCLCPGHYKQQWHTK